MTPAPHAAREPANPDSVYRIELAGRLDDHWADWLGSRTIVRDHAAGTTTLTFEIVDQSHLHGVLAGIRDLSVTLLACDRVVEGSDDPSDLGVALSEGAPGPGLERTLHTQRLTLRPAYADDADATWRYRRLESVNEWLSGCPAELDGYREMFTAPARIATTVVVALGHDTAAPVIGDLMLRREDAWAQREVADRARDAQAELGWALDPGHTGRGYATEAVRELLRHCFEDLGVHRVVANCFVANETSWRLMERVGMRREQHAVNESLHRSGRWLDTVGYAMLDAEWSAGGRAGRGRAPERGR
jgi:RimJ/RimL family protein N-acetyltransferase